MQLLADTVGIPSVAYSAFEGGGGTNRNPFAFVGTDAIFTSLTGVPSKKQETLLRPAHPMLRAKTSQIILVSLALHLALILYADHVDSHPERYGGLRYTDVDWRVVTDGARLIFNPSEEEQAKGWLVKKTGFPIGE